MDPLEKEARAQIGALDVRIAALRAAAQRVAEALAEPPPRNRALLGDMLREIQRQVMLAPPALAAMQRAQAEATRRAAAESASGRPPQAWYDLGTRAGLFRVSLNQWSRIEALVRAQIAEPRRRLVPTPAAGSMEAAKARAGDAVFDHLHRILNPLEQDAVAAGQGAYADIGLPQSRFLTLAHAAYRAGLAQGRARMDFLDVGCGIGLKLVSAAAFFDGVAGIELDPGYAERARAFLTAAALPKSRIVQCDAREFGQYGEFEVIYLFRPLEGRDEMAALEARIGEGLAPGTLVIGPYKGLAARHRAIGLRPLAPGLYVAGLTRGETAALRREAEHMGPAVRPPADPLPTVWTPVLRASHARGFDLAREGPLDHV